MKFFFDACVSVRLVRALRILAEHQHNELSHLSEVFDREGIKDPEWLGRLGQEGEWVIISGDPRISRGKAEKAAWRESGLTAFFFSDGWSSRTIWHQSSDLVRWWPDIITEARRAAPGTGYLIPLKGPHLKVIFTP